MQNAERVEKQINIDFVVVFWGVKFRDFFARFCLASILAPNNFPVFSSPEGRGFRARLLVCTTRDDFRAVSSTPLFEALKSHVRVEFVDIGLPPAGRHPILHMSYAHKLALKKIIQSGSYGSFLAPDIILADGSIATLVRHLRAGARVILAPAFRFDFDKCMDELRRLGIVQSNQPLAIPPRTLAEIAVVSVHSELRRFEFNADHFSDYPISTLFNLPGIGLLFHTSSWAIAAADFSQLERLDEAQLDSDTIDARFINDHLYPGGEPVLLSDSDDYFMMPITSEADMPQEQFLVADPYLAERGREIADLRKITFIRTFLFSAGSDEFKRWAYRKPVHIHYADLPSGAHSVIQRATQVVERALKLNTLARPIYFFTAFRGESERTRFLNNCLASLLSPGNAPELAGTGSRLIIATSEADWRAIAPYILFQRVQSFVTVEFVDAGSNFGNFAGDIRASDSCRRTARRAMQDNAYLSILPPDLLAADGTITKLIEFAEEGYRAVLAVAPSVISSAVSQNLRTIRELVSHRAIHVSPRVLVNCASKEISFDSSGGVWMSDEPPNFCLEVSGGAVIHSSEWVVLLVDISAALRGAENGEAIADLIGAAITTIGQSRETLYITDSDNLNIVRMSSTEHRNVYATATSQGIPYWLKEMRWLARLACALEKLPKDSFERKLFNVPVRWHSGDVSPVWQLMENRSRMALKDAEQFSLYLRVGAEGFEEVFEPYSTSAFAKRHVRRIHTAWSGLLQMVRVCVREPYLLVRGLQMFIRDPADTISRIRTRFRM